MLRETPSGVEIDVRVIPRARKTALGGVRGAALVVRLAAPPVEGAANKALVEYLAGLLRLPRRAVHVISGERSRNKCIAIAGVTVEAVRQLLRS